MSIFIATGVNSIITSSDGLNWTFRNTSYDTRAICYSPDLSVFIAPIYGTATIASTNPIIRPASKSTLLVNPSHLSVNSTTGATTLQSVTVNGIINANLGLTSANTRALNVGTFGTTSPANIYGLITGNNGLTISSGVSALQAVTAAGLITGNKYVN